MKMKDLRQQIEDVLAVVYENGKEGLSKDRTLFFNGANLYAAVLELTQQRALELLKVDHPEGNATERGKGFYEALDCIEKRINEDFDRDALYQNSDDKEGN